MKLPSRVLIKTGAFLLSAPYVGRFFRLFPRSWLEKGYSGLTRGTVDRKEGYDELDVVFFSQSGAISIIMDRLLSETGLRFLNLYCNPRSYGSQLEAAGELTRGSNAKVLGLCLETIPDGRRFLQRVREIAGTRPIVVHKSGTSEAARRGVLSHTGSLAGVDEICDAAFRRFGFLRARSLEEMVDYIEALARQPPAAGGKVAIITNGGGAGIVMADVCTRIGLEVAKLTEQTRRELAQTLPPFADPENPIDVSYIANHKQYVRCLQLCARCKEVDMLIVMIYPSPILNVDSLATSICEFTKTCAKPILVSSMGEKDFTERVSQIKSCSVPVFALPESSAAGALALFKHGQRVRELGLAHGYGGFTGDKAADLDDPARVEEIERLLALASTRQNKTLAEHEAKQVLGCCGVPIAEEILVGSLAEAVVAASKIGFPVVLKISSPAILHKSRVGGVRTGIRSIAELEKQYGELVNAFEEKCHGIATDGVLIQEMIQGGYELILGGVRDKSFGPVIMVGAGGILAESIKDVTFRLAPVDASESLEMLREIKLFSVLAPSQYNEPGNIKVIEGLCRKMSHLLSRFPEVEQIDLNPVVVTEKRVVVVDAKIVLS